MSKLGNKPIDAEGLEINIEKERLNLKLKDQQISVKIHEGFKVLQDGNKLRIEPESEDIIADSKRRPLLGTMIALTKNAIVGLKEQFKKVIILEGVGYKALLESNKLCLSIGYSHVVYVDIPSDVSVQLETLKRISLTSIHKEAVGDFAARLSKLKKYNPYKGIGVLIEGKFYRRKEVKKK